jgi:uncharacterized protein (DUF433 family)
MAKTLKIIGIGVVAVGVLGAAFLVVSPIAAQTLDPIWPGGPHGGGRGFGDMGAHQEALAAALGISVEDLQAALENSSSFDELLSNLGVTQEELAAAMQTAREAAIQQMVEDGTITQEQADQMLEGGFGPHDGIGFPGGGDFDGMRGFGDMEAHQEALAAALGISVEDLQAALENSSSFDELLSNLGVTQEQYDAARQTARETVIQQMVEDGTITQEQADQMLEGGFGPRDGDGFHGPHGGGSWDGDGTSDGTSGRGPGPFATTDDA